MERWPRLRLLIATTPSSSAVPPTAVVTVLKPVRAKIAYGEAVIPAGTRLEVLSRTKATLTVRYLDQSVLIPAASTDAVSDAP